MREIIAATASWRVSVDETLLRVERRNLSVFGYGAKGFILSLIETALELTARRITGEDVGEIVDMLHHFLADPRETMEGVEAVLATLSKRYRLLLITKGDVIEQEAKIARSGLAPHFDGIHILAEKDAGTYRKVLQGAGVEPQSFLMVGNSVKSDIAPVLALGARAVHIPYRITWAHETAEAAPAGADFDALSAITDLPAYLDGLAGRRRRNAAGLTRELRRTGLALLSSISKGDEVMAGLPKKGDKVSWKTPQGETHGTVEKIVTSDHRDQRPHGEGHEGRPGSVWSKATNPARRLFTSRMP